MTENETTGKVSAAEVSGMVEKLMQQANQLKADGQHIEALKFFDEA